MARSGVWDLQQVRDKYLQSEWVNYNKAFIVGNGSNGTSGLNNNADLSSPVQLPGQWNVVLLRNRMDFMQWELELIIHYGHGVVILMVN